MAVMAQQFNAPGITPGDQQTGENIPFWVQHSASYTTSIPYQHGQRHMWQSKPIGSQKKGVNIVSNKDRFQDGARSQGQLK